MFFHGAETDREPWRQGDVSVSRGCRGMIWESRLVNPPFHLVKGNGKKINK